MQNHASNAQCASNSTHSTQWCCRRWHVFYKNLGEQEGGVVAHTPVMNAKIPGNFVKYLHEFHCFKKHAVWPPGWSGWNPDAYKFRINSTGSFLQNGIMATRIGAPWEKHVVFMKMEKNTPTDTRSEWWIYHTEVAQYLKDCFVGAIPKVGASSSTAVWRGSSWGATPSAAQSGTWTDWAAATPSAASSSTAAKSGSWTDSDWAAPAGWQ